MTDARLPEFLPGRFTIGPGVPRDYRPLECFHYRRDRPRTWAAVWVVRYAEPGLVSPQERSSARLERSERSDGDDVHPAYSTYPARSCAPAAKRRSRSGLPPPDSLWPCPYPVAVGVLSWPTAVSSGRDRAFGLTGMTYGQRLRFANAHVRTISRVVVHPQFRSLGLASALVRCLCEHCPTRYVEAAAVMGRAHPLFERAGMRRVDPEDVTKPVYYVLDRGG